MRKEFDFSSGYVRRFLENLARFVFENGTVEVIEDVAVVHGRSKVILNGLGLVDRD